MLTCFSIVVISQLLPSCQSAKYVTKEARKLSLLLSIKKEFLKKCFRDIAEHEEFGFYPKRSTKECVRACVLACFFVCFML